MVRHPLWWLLHSGCCTVGKTNRSLVDRIAATAAAPHHTSTPDSADGGPCSWCHRRRKPTSPSPCRAVAIPFGPPALWPWPSCRPNRLCCCPWACVHVDPDTSLPEVSDFETATGRWTGGACGSFQHLPASWPPPWLQGRPVRETDLARRLDSLCLHVTQLSAPQPRPGIRGGNGT